MTVVRFPDPRRTAPQQNAVNRIVAGTARVVTTSSELIRAMAGPDAERALLVSLLHVITTRIAARFGRAELTNALARAATKDN